MTTSGAIDLPLQTFGSYCPELPPASLPPGLSPNCQDVEYIRGGVKTRPGLVPQFPTVGGLNPTVNYLKSYITPSEVLRLLVLDGNGVVYKETAPGVLGIIGNVVTPSYGKSATCFGREYIAFGDGINGIDMPRQYDDTNFDRVSQAGPGAAPGVTDENITLTIVASPNGLFNNLGGIIGTNITESGNIVTIDFTGQAFVPVLPGDQITVAGVGVAGYNGNFTVLTYAYPLLTYFNATSGLAAGGAGGTVTSSLIEVITTTAHPFPLTFNAGQNTPEPLVTIAGAGVGGYNGTWSVRSVISATAFYAATTNLGLAASGGGTVAVAGNITAGKHQLSVVFVTRQGYITAPAPPISWVAGGSKRAVVGSIPIGPPNVTARILIFTAAAGANYFYTGPQSPIFSGNMIIGDNTTTSVTVDFSDNVLLSGINADELFNLVELGECSGVIDYADRLFWWGERNKVNNFINLTFDGGFGGNVPLGWVLDSTGAGPGGGSNTANAVWGFAYTITADGATAVRGKITQAATGDFRGIPQLQPNTAYSVRVRLGFVGTGFTNGSLRINFAHSGGAIVGGGFTVVANTLTSVPQTEYIGSIMTAQVSIPSDLVLQVYIDGTPAPNNAKAIIDNIEIFPTNQPFNLTTIRSSFNVGSNTNLGQESYDGVTGLLQPQPFDGQGVRCMFKLREFLYIVKERSLYVTQDDGVNEPANWSIHQVSGSVGTPSVNGVGIGEDWVVIANRNGLYMFNGGEPVKISQEIQSNQTDIALTFFWDNVNWAAGQFLWTTVDTLNKRVLVGLPFAGAASPNGIFYLDYRPMNDSNDIISSTPIHTSYAGKVINYEHSRKWAPWNISANSAAIIERFDGTGQLFLGNGDATGNIYSLGESQFSDNKGSAGVPSLRAINGFYVPYGFPSHDEEEGLQLGSHKKDYTYLTAYVEGSGLLSVQFYQENPSRVAIPITSWTLDMGTGRDHEQQLGGNITAERGFFQFGTNAVGNWFKMQKFVPSLKPSVVPLRGVS